MHNDNPRPLDETRAEITAIDEQIRTLFLRRMACAEQVADYKLTHHDTILKPDREKALLESLCTQVPESLHQEYLSMQKNIMRVSRKHQYKTVLSREPSRLSLTLVPRCDAPNRVVYQGLPASYQAQAAQTMFPHATYNHVASFEDVFRAVNEHAADVGIVPIENSTVGPIHESCDLLTAYPDLHICHSHVDHIDNCLCACEHAMLETIQTVCSIQPALEQCKNFLCAHGLTLREAPNTAIAAQMVSQSGDASVAAVCSEQAAKLYGLKILARNINDDKTNQTRFIAVMRGLSARPDDNRISLVFTLPHTRGSLAGALSVCADHEINLAEIHSRPLHATPWNYRFHIDLEGSLCDPAVCSMIYQLSEELSTVHVLGSYRISESTEAR